MKRLLFLLFIVSVVAYSNGYAQFDKTSFNVSIGINAPGGDLKGNSPFNYKDKWTGYWTNLNPVPHLDSTTLYNILLTDTNFIKENYGASTGFSFFGSIKTNLDKWNTFRGLFSLSYNGFNSFQTDKTGNIPFQNYNANYTTQPITYNSSFSVFGLGLGLEVAPTSFTNIVTPYFGGTFNLNFFSMSLTRSYGRDSMKAEFGSEFRIGAALYGGIELKVSKGIDIIAGAKYDFGNLLLKTTRSGDNDVITWGKSNMSLNDAEGFYKADLTGEGARKVDTKNKNLNWWTFFLGVNFYISELSPAPKK